MKRLSLILLALISFSGVVQADDLPRRKSGLWDIKMSVEGKSGQSMLQCVDETTDAQMQEMAKGVGQSAGVSCEINETKKEGAAYVSKAVCTHSGVKTDTTATFSGDFSSSYKGEVDTTYTPALMGMTKAKMVIEANYKGDCTGDQKPGDIVMANGMKININQIPGMIGGMKR